MTSTLRLISPSSTQVTDCNDNAPSWKHEGIYSFDIPENAPHGYSVGELGAWDPDKGVNGILSYSVLSDWGNDVFSLNPESGLFSLTSRLDFEDVSWVWA